MLPYHQRWRIVGKSLKWKWVWCYDVNCRGKRWVMYLMLHLKSQWGSYLLNRVINAIYYLCLSKWRNEIRKWWRLRAICRNTALVCKLHYYSFCVCNICIISPQITPLFLSLLIWKDSQSVSILQRARQSLPSTFPCWFPRCSFASCQKWCGSCTAWNPL